MKNISYLKAAMLPAIVLLGSASSLSAAITINNPDGFESGLGNWETAGDVSIVSSGGNSYAMLTTAYASMQDDAPLASGALNLSGVSPLSAGGDLEDFVGASVGDLDPDMIDQTMEGSAISTTLNVAAGDILRFDWNLLTRDVSGLDYGFISINGSIVVLGLSGNASNPSSGNYLMETGFSSGEYVFNDAGEMKISFGVVDVGDYSATTSLMLDNVSLQTAIPEPSSACLLGVFGVAMAFSRKRR